MVTIFIDGQAGTTGLQIRDRLKNRDDLSLLAIPPEQRKNPAARRDMLNGCDIAILCLPDEAAKEAVGLIAEGASTRVIDASSAFRVHPDWAYGFPELSPQQPARIAEAKRVSNPGCYPQGLIALVKPLIDAGFMSADYPVTYNAVSGYSGGGRNMIEQYAAAGANASPYLPYGLTFAHKHLAEMKRYTGLGHAPIFQPAVGNYAQGMMGCVPIYSELLMKPLSGADARECLAAAYEGSAFIEAAPFRAMERAASLRPDALNDTNRMRLHVFANDANKQLLLMAVYDNLGKGASGAAVQNLNLMIGAPETLGVDLPRKA